MPDEVHQKISELVKREVERYVAVSDTAEFYMLADDQQQCYSVLIAPHDDERPSWVFVLARIVDDFIVIDEDGAIGKLLHQALMVNAHIPREQIILAYKGETIPVVKES